MVKKLHDVFLIKKCSFCCLTLVLGSAAWLPAAIVLSNNFDGNAGNDIGPAFNIVSNGREDNDTTDPATGLISFNDDGSAGNPTVGFSSSSSLDLSGAPGFILIWTVDNASVVDISHNGWFFGVQGTQGQQGSGNTLWNNVGLSVGVGLITTNNFIDRNSSNGGTNQTSLGITSPTNASLNSGFSITMALNSDDTWTVSSTGLSDNINTSGSLSNASYSDIASDLYVSTSFQTVSTVIHSAQYGSVTIETIPEPSSSVLLGVCSLAFVLFRRR